MPDTNLNDSGEAGFCTASSTGTFVNVVCGTGAWDGSVVISGFDANTVTLHIQMIAGLGVIWGELIDDEGVAEPVYGHVDWGASLPTADLPSSDDCLQRFTMVGELVVYEPMGR
jgi:hypothetical protein